jgi:prophage antirepressor-like protein
MDIIKAFNANDLHTEVVIKGTKTDPLFRANDIGIILEINNIRMSIIDFDESEKRAVSSTDSTGRMQEVTFLTEKGLYKVLFRSRKPIAKKFQDWACEIIQELRVNGIYDLKKDNPSIAVDTETTSAKYYFSCWIYINSFKNEGITIDTTKPENGKPIFYYGEPINVTDPGYTLDSSNNASKRLVYLQLGANSTKLQYYYTTDTNSGYKFINIKENIPIQKWTHVVISTNGKLIECYLDGKLVQTKNETFAILCEPTSGAYTINIGRQEVQKKSDTFVTKLQRVPKAADAKTVQNLYDKGPGIGLETKISQYDLKLQLTQNYNVFKSYFTG